MTIIWVLGLPVLLIWFAVSQIMNPKVLRVDVVDIPSEYVYIGYCLRYSPFMVIVIGWISLAFCKGKFHAFVHGDWADTT